MMLPQLTKVLKQIQALARQKGMVDGHVAHLRSAIRGNGYHNPIEDPMVVQAKTALNSALGTAFEQLDEWDIELKDIQTGLIDFRAMREGREIYLCWRLGEPEVEYWHELTAGFDGRQPLDDQIA
jgi:hypothetical protein